MKKKSIIEVAEYQRGYADGYKEGYQKALENYLDQINNVKPAPQIIVECKLDKCNFYKNRS